ncbi:hypothetical protein KCH_77030 [Kitasatospora cheerisanensis KCTC 2395]|uniref:Uncharacterized protein n=1 Tax=Kitasatospora cheerisanensis KCTC 2395 TaxID=1348663 RepID=A0A066YR43_9ACTN|nr:hypothetical protein KCH_77030 [Kitasatospora cheerisanensis KCTC 2395]
MATSVDRRVRLWGRDVVCAVQDTPTWRHGTTLCGVGLTTPDERQQPNTPVTCPKCIRVQETSR